jgi:hypothetical protein
MSDRIRGQETSLQVIVDGALQQGSFSKVESFKWSPRQDLTDSDFLGETESEPDLIHHGHDFSFTIHERDNSAVANVLMQVIQANVAGTALPVVNLVFIKRYRDPSIPVVTIIFQNCVIKFDSQDEANRKDYVKTAFSGKCRTVQVI